MSEASTLSMVLDALPVCAQLPLGGPPTVVMDAGIATEANLALIRSRGMDYVCVSRAKSWPAPDGEMSLIRTGPGGTVQGIRLEKDGEVVLSARAQVAAPKSRACGTDCRNDSRRDWPRLRNP